MINVQQRRLNQRYYGGQVSWHTRVNCNITGGNQGQITDRRIEEWLVQVHRASHKLNGFPCEGEIKAYVENSGYATEGKVFVFDDATLKNIDSVICDLYEAIGGFKLISVPFKAQIVISIETVRIKLFKEGGKVVPFKELDTEPLEKSTRFVQRTVPSATLN